MYKRIIFLMIVILSFSCSGKDPVSETTNEPERGINDFTEQTIIFPDGTSDTYFDADVTEILQGPGQDDTDLDGTLWEDGEGNTWSVACALRQMVGPEYGSQQIGIRFLGEGIYNMSGIIPVLDEDDEEIAGNIRLPRIAACFIDNPTQGYQGYGNRFIEVSIAYQIWDVVNLRWDIHVVRTGFEPVIYDADDWETVNSWAEDRLITQASPSPQHGMMMPDIAYDPRNDDMPYHSRGDLYLVYTYYNNDPNLTEGVGPRVYVTYGIRYDTNFNPNDWHYTEFGWFGCTLIHYLHADPAILVDKICHGFHPKIDIGFIDYRPFDLNDDPVWTVAVAFTADKGFFEPHIVTWNAGYPFLAGLLELPISSNHAGFMPSIDIGLRDPLDPDWANHCAVTWTQTRSEDWNDVTIGYVDNHGGARLGPRDPVGVMEGFAFPSAAVWGDTGDPDVFRTSVSYLNSLNPVLARWDSYATTFQTTVDFPTPATCEPYGVETDISTGVHGLYDSGSQYSNWYGMSSSMTVNDYGYYWVLYSAMPDPELEGVSDLNINQVYGAYGATD